MRTKELTIIALSAALNTILMSFFPWIGLVLLSVWMISFKKIQALIFALIVAFLMAMFASSPLVWLNIILFPILAILLHSLKSWMLVGSSKNACLSANSFDVKKTFALSMISFIVINGLNELLSFVVIHQNYGWFISGLGLAFLLSLFNAIVLSVSLNSLVKVISKGFLRLALF